MTPTFNNSIRTPHLWSIKQDINSFIQSEGVMIKFWLCVVLVKFKFEADLKLERVSRYSEQRKKGKKLRAVSIIGILLRPSYDSLYKGMLVYVHVHTCVHTVNKMAMCREFYFWSWESDTKCCWMELTISSCHSNSIGVAHI